MVATSDLTPLVVCSVPFLGGLLALGVAVALYFRVRKAPTGEGVQVDIAGKISRGARAFLKTEYLYLLPFVIVMAAFIVGVLQGQPTPPRGASTKGGWQAMICFLIGAILSALSGWIGMDVATQSNVRTMEAAKSGLNPALQVAFAGGAVMGFTVVSLGLLGITILLFAFTQGANPSGGPLGFISELQDSVRYLAGFGFGGSAIALFARVAGGIYTKAADVGADLVGKVESDIPEDDPRNPATIADNVGDNVGDVAGMGADLFESFVGSIIAAASLASNERELALPFWIAGFGILASAISIAVVRTKDDAKQKELLHALHGGVYSASILIVLLSALTVWLLFSDGNWNLGGDDVKVAFKYFGCIVIGLVAGIGIGEATEYFTSYAYSPTTSITQAGSMGGAATVIIQGLGIGMLSCVPPVVIIVATIIACYALGGVYGISMAAVGMLSTLGITLATDAYGPVADNAGGIAEMTPGVGEEVRERTDALDALGNTTAATGKGFAIGSAVLTALALMSAYCRAVGVDLGAATSLELNLTEPLVLSGALFGAMLPFLFGALTMLSVRKAAGSIIVEVQKQFREIKGLLAGEPGVECDSDTCVALCTRSSVKEMILPGGVAIFAPITIGLLIGAKCLGGMLVGAIASGFVLAVMMSNAGGAWDNSKKYIENENTYGGKKSETHKACVVGDTVGDPFKDTSGPALNILIKLMSVLALLLAPIFREDWATWWVGLIVLAVAAVVCAAAYYFVWVKGDEQPKPKSEEVSS